MNHTAPQTERTLLRLPRKHSTPRPALRLPAAVSWCTAGHYFNRIWVISLGCTIWGIMTCGFAFCKSKEQGYFFWAMNGVGLSMVIPNGQSVTADYYSEAARGRAFGYLYLTGALGAMVGTLYATNLGACTARERVWATMDVRGSVQRWRLPVRVRA